MADAENSRTHWHLDKRVPVSIIVSIAIQTATAIWWARGQVAIDDDHERRVVALEKSREGDKLAERIAVLETKVIQVLAAMQEISRQIQQDRDERNRKSSAPDIQRR